MFLGYWYALDGKKLRRAKRSDIATAYRLIARHRDIYEWGGR